MAKDIQGTAKDIQGTAKDIQGIWNRLIHKNTLAEPVVQADVNY